MRRLAAIAPMLVAAGCGCSGDPGGGGDDAPAPCDPPEERTGEGTYYAADGSGACSFDPVAGEPLVAAMNAPDFAGAAVCGMCVAVDGPDGSVTVRIVDLCPGCVSGDLDLSVEAFARIAEPSAGRVPISWRAVPCDVTGPVRYRWKEGTNPAWAAIQVRDHRHAIASLEARPAGGEWQPVARAPYDYFVAEAGLGDGAIGVRITDVHGHVLEDEVGLGDGVEVAGAAQLPVCE